MGFGGLFPGEVSCINIYKGFFFFFGGEGDSVQSPKSYFLMQLT